MKYKLEKIKQLFIILIAIFTIIACEKDLYEDAIQQNQNKQINIKPISLEKFNFKMRQIKNKPEIERFMFPTKNTSLLSRTESTSEFEIITDDIKEITQGDYTSYTMYLKTPDTTNNIYNITIEEIDGYSSFFITKYIPTTYWLENKDLPFEGEIITYRESNTNSGGANTLQEYLDLINGELYAAGGGGGGLSGTGNSTSTSYPYDCNGMVYETTIVTEIKCGCGHNWQDLLTGTCTGCQLYSPTYPSLSTTTTYQCIPISSNTSGSGNTSGSNTLGGGGSGTGTGTGGTSTGTVTGSITTIVDPTEECNAPRGDLNNDCVLDDDEANFVTFLDGLSSQERLIITGNNTTKMNTFYYLVDQNYSIDSKMFVEELIIIFLNNSQPVYTTTDYPGKDEGMPFEWWKNNNYMTTNFDVLEEDPNLAELLAFSLFPDKALLHIQNSITALDKAQQLVLNNTLTGIEDGRADAFRHAYWNALDTAEFGSNITQIFTDAHEAYSSGLPKQMDLHNNRKGREKAISMTFNFLSSDSDIADSILIEVYIGHLLYISNGALITTD